MKTPAERLWRRVQMSDACWLWTGPLNRPGGYGYLRVNGQQVYAHRLAYELTVGPIPDGLSIDHLCRTTRCVRPSHLEPVTQAENVRRGAKASRGRCEHGFDFPMADGGRGCRVCIQAASTARQRRGRERRAMTRLALLSSRARHIPA